MKIRIIIIVSLISIISLLHYLSPTTYHHLHAILQRLYYIPIIFSAYWFGSKYGFLTAFLTGLFYAPHIFFQWSFDPMESFTQYVEICMFLIIGTLVGLLTDIEKKQYKELNEANLKIHRMDRLSLLGQLAAGLAHEIRNPLGSLIGSIDILKDGFDKNDKKYEFLAIIDKEIHRLRNKLDEFLKFAKPSPPQKIPNNLNDVINAAISLTKESASKNSIEFELNLNNKMPLIPIDGELIKQILINLILNAIQAMPEGGKIQILSSFDNFSISFSIKDEGNGIPHSELEEIYKPFYTTKENGTGLGLSVVKELVVSMNGTIFAESGDNGTCFNLRIPYE